MEAQGKGFLKVCGILMIIFGSISIVVSLIAFSGVAVLAALGASSAMLYISCIFSLASSAAELVAGIIGVKNCADSSKAGVCMTWGVIVAACCILGQIISIAGGGKFSVFSLILGLVLPVLFIIGAAKNKQ
ncbi:MAG: hypothetical protein ACI4EF_13145 [Coprococcus sp.]